MHNKYPVWKNILLVVIALIGLLYAVPNLYSEEPSIQVSSQADTPINVEELKTKINQALANAKISPLAIHPMADGVDLRFASPDIQLAAQDVLKNTLGADFTVALNLASSTPAWLSKIGAEPIKQKFYFTGRSAFSARSGCG